MELHLSDDDVAALDQEPGQDGMSAHAAIESRVTLAWHLRERDSLRALRLAEGAARMLRNAGAAIPADKSASLAARLALARAEASALLFRIEDAEAALADARRHFDVSGDRIGLGDAGMVEAAIAIACGDSDRFERAFSDAVLQFSKTDDVVRLGVARAWSAYVMAYFDPAAALDAAQRLRDEWQQPMPIPLLAVLCGAEAAALFWRDPPRSAALALRAREFADRFGIVRLAVIASSNAGWVLECLGDFDAALECIEWSVNRARQAEWPMVIASAEVRLGSVLRELGQLDRSHDILSAAAKRFEALPRGTHKAIALSALGQTLMAKGETEAAVSAFETSARLCREARSTDNLVDCVIHLAQARSAAGKPDAALEAIAEAEALIETHGFAERRVAVAQAMAAMHGDGHESQQLPAPPEMTAPNPRLHYLQEALHYGRAIADWQPSGALLMALAEAHAGIGDSVRAYEYAKEVVRIEQSGALRKAANRSTLMQVRHETARALAEAEHHRQLAAEMTRQSQTLEELGRIGQEITANLDHAGVFAALARHLGALVDAAHLSIWLVEEDGQRITLRLGSEDGQAIAPRSIDVDHPRSRVAACVRSRAEERVTYAPGDDSGTLIPGTRDMRTAYFAPLVVGERVLGAISIQSARVDAYGERELLIFRTLCAYSAIALDNTRAYQQLHQARAQLEEASLTDPLTGLRNRRYLMLHADVDASLAIRRYEQASDQVEPPADADLVFLLIDIDHFKSVNDLHGHAAGDAVLTQMRARLEQVFRVSDHLVRWGGEEFLIVARSTTRQRAEELAERVCATVRAEPFRLPDGTALSRTCSLGYACYPFRTDSPRAVTWQEVIDLADIALYAAKRGGRNTWVGVHAGEVACDVREIKSDAIGATRRGAVRFRGALSDLAIQSALADV
jgi:diguanylate cyclase (GGDEF)-like protein